MRRHIRILAGRIDRAAGSHVYHHQLAMRLLRRGYRVSVICFSVQPELAGDLGEITPIPRKSFEFPGIWRLASPLQYVHCSRNIRNVQLTTPDLVIGGEHLFLKAHDERFQHVPWIYLPHSLLVDLEIQSYGAPGIARTISSWTYVHLQRWALAKANATLRFTHQACDALKRRYPSLTPRFSVNPMGIDLPPRHERTSNTSAPELLFVGQLITRKRIDVALHALTFLRDLDWCFRIIGDGPLRKSLEREVHELNLADRVRFYGFQTDPSPWYRNADLFLLPSWLENFPVTIMESMSYGVSCLTMRADGKRIFNANSEIIQDGIDGFLANSTEDFTIQLRRLVANPELLRQCGRAARRSVERQYTWDLHLDRYEALFDQLAREYSGKQ
jgi:glycosyltransferase involved in cell wall biosynthesis